ncbi:MAG: cyclic nucleotide-binding domain-containing protein [Chloroflexi bacterium]|nr:cyclic nucleotide-binding domain-containing protein [Chloroflexota bacterium]
MLQSRFDQMPRLPWFHRRRDGAGGILERAPFLSVLEPELRQRVRKRLTRRKVESGKSLYRQGEAADALYLIESGRFRLFVSERPGQERVLQFLGSGEIIGEAAFIAETAYVTSAIAIEDAFVLRLARADFDNLLGKNDAILRYLAGVISERQALANARLAAESQPEESRASRGFVTAVYSPRGGSGVTTIALNLAIALAQRHPDDVALLDLDVLFGHALGSLWLEPRGVLAQASPVTLRTLDRPGLDIYLIPHSSSLRIFPAATKPEEGQTITAEQVHAIVTVLRRHFGYVVLDLPHTFSEIALSGLELADRVLVIATPESTSLRDVLETRRILTEVLSLPTARLAYVLNRPHPYASLGVSEFAAATAAPWTEIGHGGDAPATAALRGESLVDTRRNNAVVRGVIALAEQITTEAREHAALSGRSA